MDTDYLVLLVQTALRHSGVRQKTKDIYRILCSDERYPSALSIIKTLAFWGVTANAYQADLENLKNEKGVKIVHLNINGGRFFIVKEIQGERIIIKDNQERTLPLDVFIELWDGCVIIVEPNRDRCHAENKFNSRIALVLGVSAYLICISPDKIGILTDLLGLLISYNLLFHSIYTFSNLPLCVIGRKFDCNTVANSYPFSKRFNINLPLLSLWYFLTDTLLVTLNLSEAISTVMCLCALPVVAYLLIYQLFFIKRKCFYCMLVSVCVIVKAILALLKMDFIKIESPEIPAVGFIFIVSSIITSLIYDIMTADEKEIRTDMQLLQQKRKNSIALITNGDDVTLSDDFCMSFGNHDAPLVIETIVSSECRHCMKLISDMFRIMRKYSEYVMWNVYWTKLSDGEIKGKENKDILALAYIQDYLDNRCDLDKYPYKKEQICNHKISESAVTFLNRSTSYLHKQNVDSFPHVYVNHKHISNSYSINDLDVIINDWIMEGKIPLIEQE